MVTPVLLRSFGRSGSTFMMQLLGSHENVLFERAYPFENRYLTYLARVAALTGMAPNNDDGWNHDRLMHNNIKRVGPLPYQNVSAFDKSSMPKTVFSSLWGGFSKSLHCPKNDLPVFYAEKVAHDICALVNQSVYTKNLFLIRDPRDEFLSIKSFNKKRGFNGFGWQENDTDESFALRLCRSRKKFMQTISKIDEKEERRIMVRYEDAIENADKTCVRLSDWLGVQLDAESVQKNAKNFQHHMTSEKVSDSVQRWKKEMNDSLKDVFATELGEEMTALGYEKR
ncbi:sulfotransferase domain-containing protein [Halomonas sp. KX33721]|uniref:sulfotransferase domain-containing protein n=1 Tax=Halomonas sp. KX33721 TaxID=1819251 RepID=UPI0009FF8025|nr:sulfotransferase domain-containing protein [Halomonas sp. KX33721]